jgi:hypothetical protein
MFYEETLKTTGFKHQFHTFLLTAANLSYVLD